MSTRTTRIPDGVPFVPGSDASRAGAAAVGEAAPVQEARVYEAILAAGEEGMTDREIEAFLGMIHQSASRARRYLVRRGRVRDSGLRRISRVEKKSKVRVTAWVVGEDPDVVAGPPIQERVSRPTADSINRSLHEIRDYVEFARPSRAPSEDLQALGRWLRFISKYERGDG
jgi:hypothetical protein